MATRVRKKRSVVRADYPTEVATTAALVELAREAQSTPGVLRVRTRASAVEKGLRRVVGFDWDPPQRVKLDLLRYIERGWILMIVECPPGTLTPEIQWRLNEARRQDGLESLSHPWTVILPIDAGVAHLFAEVAVIEPEPKKKPKSGELF